jgi:aspartyl protease family protein
MLAKAGIRSTVRIALCAAMCAGAQSAPAATLYVKALTFSRAEVVINGGDVRSVWSGDTTPEGVKLRSVTDDSAVFEVDGKVWTLKPGEGTYSQATLRADAHGQFFVTARVNDAPFRAIIDTGATSVAMNSDDAYRLGIDYLRGRRVVTQTASGPRAAYLVTFSSVQVGDIVLTNVPGAVLDVRLDELPLVLIGMSFLRNVDMRRSGDMMLLRRPDY